MIEIYVKKSIETVYILHATEPTTATSYLVTGLEPETKYDFKLVRTGGEYTPTYITATTTGTITTLKIPSLSINAYSSTNVRLDWWDVSNELGYEVQKSDDGGVTWATIGNKDANILYHIAGNLLASTTYKFRVRAIGDAVYTLHSGYDEETVTTPPAGLTQLDGTQPSSTVDKTTINLAWTDVLNDSGYRIERSLNSYDWTLVTTTAASATSYSDTALAEGTLYYYRVRAEGDLVTYSHSPWLFTSATSGVAAGSVVQARTAVSGKDLNATGYVVLSSSGTETVFNQVKKTSGGSAFNAAYQELDAEAVPTIDVPTRIFYEMTLPATITTNTNGLNTQVGMVEAANTAFQPIGFFLWFYNAAGNLRTVLREDDGLGGITETISPNLATTFTDNDRFAVEYVKATGEINFHKWNTTTLVWDKFHSRVGSVPTSAIFMAALFRQGNPSSELLALYKTVD